MPLGKDEKSRLAISLWYLQVVIVLVLISLVIWLTLRPKHPVCKITDVYIPALDRGNSTIFNNEASRNTSIIFNVEFSNPNKRMTIYYDDIHITLYSNDAAVIGTKSLPGFYQGYRSTIIYEVLMNADSQQLRKGSTSNSTDMIKVHLETAARYKIISSTTKHHQMDFEAYIGIGSDGRISGDRDIKLQHMVKR